MKLLESIFKQVQSNGQQRVVGVDIGSSSMKVVELEERKGIVTLTTYGELQLGPYASTAIGESVTLDAKQEQTALVDIIRESAVKARSAVFAMPLASSFVTNVSIDAAADADISAMVRVEARKVIPAALSEVTLDWAEVEQAGTFKTDERKQRNVLVAAIQNNALSRFRVLMQFAGLQNPPTEIECFSAIRALYSSADDHIAIIDVGATSSKLYISKGGLLMRMHRMRSGGALVTKRLATVLEVDFEAAELQKRSVQPSERGYADVQRAHASSYERAFREFSQVLTEYERSAGVTIAQVQLCGGGGAFPSVLELLKDATRRDVVRANPFAKVAYPAFMDDMMHEIGPSFTVALGAAIRAFE